MKDLIKPLIRALDLKLNLKRDSGTGVSCEFCEISNNTFLYKEHLWMNASVRLDFY